MFVCGHDGIARSLCHGAEPFFALLQRFLCSLAGFSGGQMSSFGRAMVPGPRFVSTLSREALRFRPPVAVGPPGLPEKPSNTPRPRISPRLVIGAFKYAALTATIVKAGVRTR